MARRRRFTTFNLSFLDIMSCGFGAVVLVFLIIDHAIVSETEELNADLMSEVSLLEEEVLEGEEGLVQLRNTLSAVSFDIVEAQGLATRINEEIEEYEARLESLRREGFSEDSEIQALKAEIQQLEEEVEKLRAASQDTGGVNARTFQGEGNRQYLTGLKLGGRNIMILLDASSSMLAGELVNVIRLRNMDDSVKRRAGKWRRAVETVSWLTAQLPPSSEYQVYTFNTTAKPLLSGTEGSWLEVTQTDQLNQVVAALDQVVPSGGTSLHHAFQAAVDMSPMPDNIFLITDGLPTQGEKPPSGTKINGRERMRLFERAVRVLPRTIPVNVILEPMEGDPRASSAFWQLAQVSSGSFLTPAEDWP